MPQIAVVGVNHQCTEVLVEIIAYTTSINSPSRQVASYTAKETSEIAQLIKTHNINEITSLASNQSLPKHHQYPKLDNHEPLQRVSFDCSTVTEELTAILASLEQSKGLQVILIKGAPA